MRDNSVDLWATDEGALSAARLALPHVDPARNQGPGSPTRPHPQECGLFRGRRFAGWALCVPSGNRQIQWTPAFFRFSSNSAPPVAGRGDGLWSSPTMPGITTPACTDRGGNSTPIPLLWTSFPLQSRTESDRARVEAHAPSLPAQSLLRQAPRRHQRG